MTAKKAPNHEALQNLIDSIQEIKRINVGKISILAGYKRENYLSERLSTGKVSDKVIKRVALLYHKAKLLPEILDDVHNVNPVQIVDAPGSILEFLIRIESKVNILFSNEAEKTAITEGKKPIDVLREMNAAARLEADNLQEALRRNR